MKKLWYTLMCYISEYSVEWWLKKYEKNHCDPKLITWLFGMIRAIRRTWMHRLWMFGNLHRKRGTRLCKGKHMVSLWRRPFSLSWQLNHKTQCSSLPFHVVQLYLFFPPDLCRDKLFKNTCLLRSSDWWS